MKKLSRIEQVILLVNTGAFLLWLGWLVFYGRDRFYSQEGIMLYVPCIPIFFIYIFLFSKGAQEGNAAQDESETHAEPRHKE